MSDTSVCISYSALATYLDRYLWVCLGCCVSDRQMLGHQGLTGNSSGRHQPSRSDSPKMVNQAALSVR